MYELTSSAKGQVKNLTRAWATACLRKWRRQGKVTGIVRLGSRTMYVTADSVLRVCH